MIDGHLKILILRFSSFGDVTQALSIPAKLKELAPNAQIHFVTRADFAPLMTEHPLITKVWSFSRKDGLGGLVRLALTLQKEHFTHIYDAHNSTRSKIICWFLRFPLDPRRLFTQPAVTRKSQKRWKRFLLFRFRINRFQMPFSGQRDLLEPAEKWGLSTELPAAPQLYLKPETKQKVETQLLQMGLKNYVALAPSAAHFLKRWPVHHWKTLITKNPSLQFVCLGGPEDTFIQELVLLDPARIHNMAGKLSLLESAVVVANSKCLVTNDTGLLHVAEQLGKKAVALMGPAPFGFPSRKSTDILELNLYCKPCSKHGQGPCVNREKFHKCMEDLTPEFVSEHMNRLIEGAV